MQEIFASRTELEEKLMEGQEGQLPGDEFMHYPDWPVGMDLARISHHDDEPSPRGEKCGLEPEMVRQLRVN